MIPRYSRAECADIWSPQTKYSIWFEIEAHAADAMAERRAQYACKACPLGRRASPCWARTHAPSAVRGLC